jgi:hypothetical protein
MVWCFASSLPPRYPVVTFLLSIRCCYICLTLFRSKNAAILAATSAARPRADVAYLINAIAKRLSKTHNWSVSYPGYYILEARSHCPATEVVFAFLPIRRLCCYPYTLLTYWLVCVCLQVALKTLMVVHRCLREGDPTFREELINFSRSRNHLLNMSHFKDDSSPPGRQHLKHL